MQMSNASKRVVVVHWKNRTEKSIEVFSSLKNFSLSYKDYNYNTLNNYLGKKKIPFDNHIVRVERQYVFLKPKPQVAELQIQPVVRKVALSKADDYSRDLGYWLSRPIAERLAAVTQLVRQAIPKGEQMDKQKIVKRKRAV
jgi:hypothetical protein